MRASYPEACLVKPRKQRKSRRSGGSEIMPRDDNIRRAIGQSSNDNWAQQHELSSLLAGQPALLGLANVNNNNCKNHNNNNNKARASADKNNKQVAGRIGSGRNSGGDYWNVKCERLEMQITRPIWQINWNAFVNKSSFNCLGQRLRGFPRGEKLSRKRLMGCDDEMSDRNRNMNTNLQLEVALLEVTNVNGGWQSIRKPDEKRFEMCLNK